MDSVLRTGDLRLTWRIPLTRARHETAAVCSIRSGYPVHGSDWESPASD